jgi:7,8-dihydro-6-hydroxymethylpterin-pyrophosphokinase
MSPGSQSPITWPGLAIGHYLVHNQPFVLVPKIEIQNPKSKLQKRSAFGDFQSPKVRKKTKNRPDFYC